MESARRRGALVAVLLLTLLAWLPSLRNDFTWDDRTFAMGVSHPWVGTLHAPHAYWGAHYWQGKIESAPGYRPLTLLSFAVRHAVFGDSAFVAHLINVLLHVLATFFVVRLLESLAVPWRAALAGGLVFGLHAIHSEVVANVVGRAELLAFVCGAGAALLMLGRPATGRRIAAALLLFLAFSSKESAIAWAPFIACLAFVRHGRARPPFGAVAAVVLPCAVFLVLRARVVGFFPADDPTTTWIENPLRYVELPARLMTAVLVQGYALLLCLLPFRLSAEYGHAIFPIVHGPLSDGFAAFLIAACMLAGFLAVALVSVRRLPLLFLAGASFFGFSFIVSNILMPVLMVLGERTYYAPSLALSFAVALLAQQRVALRLPLRVAFGVWLAGSAAVGFQRSAVWHDNASLVATELAAQPRSVRMQMLAGIQDLGTTRADSALVRFTRACELDPENPDAWQHRAMALGRLGRTSESLDCFARALRGRERDVKRLGHEIHGRFGLALARAGRAEQALAELEASRAARPTFLRHSDAALAFVGRLTHDRATPLELRRRAARLGRALWPAATASR